VKNNGKHRNPKMAMAEIKRLAASEKRQAENSQRLNAKHGASARIASAENRRKAA